MFVVTVEVVDETPVDEAREVSGPAAVEVVTDKEASERVLESAAAVELTAAMEALAEEVDAERLDTTDVVAASTTACSN